ncbi:MAG: DUF4339 domain-containing protein [Burkholderiales bacterium]|nr:DUF4339 domain-containing protein [Phycisphaerae bacterium]
MNTDPQAQWYIARGQTPVGPVPFATLQADARAGKLSPEDRVWTTGAPAWVRAASVPDLFATHSAGEPPPLPPTVEYAAPVAPDLGASPGMRMLIPVGRSGWAIAAGYAGLLSVLIIFAPFALIFGILAIREMRRDPNKHGMGRAVFGIVMGTIFTLGILIFVGYAILQEM